MRAFLFGCLQVLLAGGVIFVLGLLLADRIFPPLVHRSYSTGEMRQGRTGRRGELPGAAEAV